MAKKKTNEAEMSDEHPAELPAELPEPEPEPAPQPMESDTPVVGTSQHAQESERYAMVAHDGPHGVSAMVAKDAPGPKSYYLIIDGVRCVHVGDTPDGRWVYRPD